MVHTSPATTLENASRKHQDRFDKNDEQKVCFLEEKRLYKAHQYDTNSSKKVAYSNTYVSPEHAQRHAR